MKVYKGVGALVVRNGQVLLLRRKSDGLWTRPGGMVEEGETLEEGLIREILEETGITVRIERLLDTYETTEKGKNWMAYGYLASYVSGEATNKEPDKHTELKWFKLDELPETMNEYTKRSIRKLKGEKKDF